MEQEIGGNTLLQFKARVAGICLQEREAMFAESAVTNCWLMGINPRETFEELKLEREIDTKPRLREEASRG